MHKTEPVFKTETHKLLWDFEIQTDHLISARRLTPRHKKKLYFSGFCPSGGTKSQDIRNQKDKQLLRPCQRAKRKVVM